MPATLDSAYNFCEKVTKITAKNFFYAFRVLPKEKRRAIYVIYAFCRECDDIADGDQPAKIKLKKLNEIANLFNHSDSQGLHRTNPIFIALEDVIKKYKIPKNYFVEFIDGMTMDQKLSRYSDFQELKVYCYKVASVVGLMCIEIFGYRVKNPKILEHAENLGIAMQLTNIIRDIKEDVNRNRIYLPQADLTEFDYTESELKSSVHNKKFCSLMALQTERVKTFFKASEDLEKFIFEDARSCIKILRSLYLNILLKIEASGYQLFGAKIELSRTEKFTLMFQLWIHHVAITFTKKLKSTIIKS